MSAKLKILCLHGYRQNDLKFKSQIGALRKILKNHTDFYFISAPHVIPVTNTPKDVKNDNQRGWWFTKENSFNAKDRTDQCFGLDESIKLIEEFFRSEGPFDGILGFSQGAALIAIICSLKELGHFGYTFTFAIIISGFKSLCRSHSAYYESKINIPSLHVFGNTDEIINRDMSLELADLFVNPVIINHEGGHYVPANSNFKNDYINFINLQKSVSSASVQTT